MKIGIDQQLLEAIEVQKKMLSALITSIRLKHVIKNLFIFFPVFFAGKILSSADFSASLIIFVSFTFQAWAIYLFNDIIDCNQDKLHPDKKTRPIAGGLLPLKIAALFAVLFTVLAFSVALSLNYASFFVIATYLIINILYSLIFKNMAIFDVLFVSIGFVLRLVAGSTATGISLSHWIIIMTFLLALFLAIAKRRKDLLLFEKDGIITRKSITSYSLGYIDSVLSMLSGVIIVSYLMYTISDDVIAKFHFEEFYITVIFVIIGLLRYFQQIIVFNNNDNPILILYKDRILQISVAGWILTIFSIVYIL